MRFRIVARRMGGKGNEIVCRRCSHRILLPTDPFIIIWDDGLRMTMRDPTDKSIRHRCGRVLEWYCPLCRKIGEPALRSIKGRRAQAMDITCPSCREGDLIQREKSDTAKH